MGALNQISSGAQHMAKSVETGITSLTQIEQGARLGKERAESSLKACEKMLTGIEENKTTVDEMILAITESTKAATENLNEMANIERISRRIDKIVDGISNVSIQTAMLAVNGAVEAARAGEYGKGFAVVSTDIQNLANDAAENAEQIKIKLRISKSKSTLFVKI